MANNALAALESALRDRKLDRTLITTLAPLDRHDPSALIPTDPSGLDRWLHSSASALGAVPRGQVSELAGPCSSGRTTLLLQMMAAVTQRGELAALVDTCDSLDVASAIAAGVDVDRLLWIRGDAPPSSGGFRPDTIERVVDRALKALNLVLQAGGFALVAIDLSDVPPLALKRLPFTTWLRVQRIIEGSDTACVLVVPEPLARSAGGLTLTLAGRATWAGTGDRSRRLTGMDVGVKVISPRHRRVEGAVRIEARANDSH
jgi:hypothetical protein